MLSTIPKKWRYDALLPLALALGAAACTDASTTSSPPAGGSSFETAAHDPAAFRAPLDAAALSGGRLAFLASKPASAGDAAGQTALFVRDEKGIRALDVPLGMPLSLVTDGADTIYVADWVAGDTGAVLRISASTGIATPVAGGVSPKGLALDKEGTLYVSGTNPQTGASGVYRVSGSEATPVAEGGLLHNLSGIDVDDDGTVYVVSPTASRYVDEDKLVGEGTSVLYRIAGGTTSVISAGFATGEPSGIALAGTKLLVSSYEPQGPRSAVLVFDTATNDGRFSVYSNETLSEIRESGGLHRDRTTGALTWSGGDTVFAVKL